MDCLATVLCVYFQKLTVAIISLRFVDLFLSCQSHSELFPPHLVKTPKMTAFMENMKAQNSQLLLPSSAEDVKTMMKACLYDKSKATENPQVSSVLVLFLLLFSKNKFPASHFLLLQILLGVLQLRAPKEEFNKTREHSCVPLALFITFP